MYSIYRQDGDISYGVKQFILDNPSDLNSLPSKKCHPGSLAFIISTSEYYMLNNEKEWIYVTLSNGGSGGPIVGDDGGLLRMF